MIVTRHTYDARPIDHDDDDIDAAYSLFRVCACEGRFVVKRESASNGSDEVLFSGGLLLLFFGSFASSPGHFSGWAVLCSHWTTEWRRSMVRSCDLEYA